MWTSSDAARRVRRSRVGRAVALAVAVAVALAAAALIAAPAAAQDAGQDASAVAAASGGDGSMRALAPDDLGDVVVAVLTPANDPQVDLNARKMLETRLTSVLTSAGMAGVGTSAPFAIYPVVSVVDERTTDGGLRPLTVVTLELGFVVGNVASRASIHQWSGRVVGTARTREGAISQAIASLGPANPALREFGAETRRRIVAYYESACTSVRARARSAAAAGRELEALAELMAVPSDARACRDAAIADAEAIVARREARDCALRVRAARADIAKSEFDDAADELAAVPPGSPCSREADALLRTLEQRAMSASSTTLKVKVAAARKAQVTTGATRLTASVKREVAAYFNKTSAKAIRFDTRPS